MPDETLHPEATPAAENRAPAPDTQAPQEPFALQPQPLPPAPPEPKRPAAAVSTGRKAAFTLRLDGDRHLRLRLANAVTGRSAQQIVTAALDD